MATIRKRGARWQVQIRRDGHAAISKSFVQKGDAQLWARQTEAQLDRADLPPNPIALRQVRFSEILIRYRDTVVSTKRAAPVERIILDAFLKRPLAKLMLADLRPEAIARYRDDRLIKVKPATICREFGLLRHALHVAKAEWGIPIGENPFSAIDDRVPGRGVGAKLLGSVGCCVRLRRVAG